MVITSKGDWFYEEEVLILGMSLQIKKSSKNLHLKCKYLF